MRGHGPFFTSKPHGFPWIWLSQITWWEESNESEECEGTGEGGRRAHGGDCGRQTRRAAAGTPWMQGGGVEGWEEPVA